MKTFAHGIAPLVLVVSLGCSGGADGEPADGERDRGPSDGDLTDGDGDIIDASLPGTDGDGGEEDGDALPSNAPCPATAPGGAQVVVFGEGDASGWSSYAFTGALVTETTNVCSGAVALKYTTGQYDGLGFGRASPLAAVHLSVRV